MASGRPSTSGSLTATGPSRSDLDKRTSKDDMIFTKLRPKQGLDKRISRDDMYIRRRMAEMSQHHVPVKGAKLAPERSPKYKTLQEVSMPVSGQSPVSSTSGEIPIGMAFGSPTTLRPGPDPSRWQAQFPSTSSQINSTSEPSSAGMAPVGSLQRKKTGRRKLFGLFGGGKKRDGTQGLGQSDAGKSTMTLGRTVDVTAPPVSVAAKSIPARSNTQVERNPQKHKPIMIRSNTVPYNIDEPPIQPKSDGLPGRQGHIYGRHQTNNAPVPSFLDVNIPDTRLERYSVMFSDVLGCGPKQEPAGSLLSRRQATLQRLKTIDDKIEVEEMERDRKRERAILQRRATSPQPTATPQLRLFPMPSGGRVTPAMDTATSQSRPGRSSTSPGRLPSPTQKTFDTRPGPSATMTGHGPTLVVPKHFENSPPLLMGPTKQEPEPIYPTDTSFQFLSDKSGLILDSPTEIEPPAEITISQPFKPTLHEPQWKMVSTHSVSASSATPSVFSSTNSAAHQRSTSAASSDTTHTHVSRASVDLDADAAFQSAVEVSIARQISISRQQRQLLTPLQARRGMGGGEIGRTASPLGVRVVKSPSPRRRLGDEGSIKETKSSTPTLIHPRESPVNPAHLAQNRKSSWAVVEDG